MYPSADPEYRKEYHRRYYEANPEKWEAYRERQKKWHQENPERVREARRRYHLKKKYGIVGPLPPEMGECESCGKYAKLDQDHSHKTGTLRGRICRGCNTIAANLEHPNRENVEKYLRRYDR